MRQLIGCAVLIPPGAYRPVNRRNRALYRGWRPIRAESPFSSSAGQRQVARESAVWGNGHRRNTVSAQHPGHRPGGGHLGGNCLGPPERSPRRRTEARRQSPPNVTVGRFNSLVEASLLMRWCRTGTPRPHPSPVQRLSLSGIADWRRHCRHAVVPAHGTLRCIGCEHFS